MLIMLIMLITWYRDGIVSPLEIPPPPAEASGVSSRLPAFGPKSDRDMEKRPIKRAAALRNGCIAFKSLGGAAHGPCRKAALAGQVSQPAANAKETE